MLKIVTMAGLAPILSLDQYILALPASIGEPRSDYVEFDSMKSLSHFSFEEPSIYEDATYERKFVKVLSNSSIFNTLKNQFLKQLEESVKTRDYTELDSTLYAFEEASVEYLNNFGGEKFAFINLGRGNYILASLEADDIQLRRLDVDKLCVIVFKPLRFVPFKAGNITSLKKELKRMMRYQDGIKRTRFSKQIKKSLR